ncbi:MAG: hypothetical protein WCH34_14925 [Bacteroidota bacterium]
MKKFYLFIISILLLSANVYAQTPQAINYQGVARDTSGNVIANQPVSLRLSLLSGSASGAAAYVETHAVTTDGLGLFSSKIGQGIPVSGIFSAINWGSNSYYLRIEIDPNGGANYHWVGTNQFVSVPYAFYATQSGTGGATGATGANGANGIQGVAGNTGPLGATGANGQTGAQGIQGLQGVNGKTGATGASGLQGIQGLAGANGQTGANGANGAMGQTGVSGTNGTTGMQGIQGISGATGTAGTNGAIGATGFTGVSGSNGITGATGAGITGVTGKTGATGPSGAIGGMGANGISIQWLGTFPMAPSNPTINQAYHLSTMGISYIWDGTAWQMMNRDGQNGTNGTNGLAGADGVTGATGAVGATGIASQTLDQTLSMGNSAGLYNIDMNGQSITNASNFSLQSIGSSSTYSLGSTNLNYIDMFYGHIRDYYGSHGASGQVLTARGTYPYNFVSWENPVVPTLPSGVFGQTLRHDGTGWVGNSLLYNNGSNIGIGTTSPNTLLDIEGLSWGTVKIKGTTGSYLSMDRETNANTSYIDFSRAGLPKFIIGNYGSDDYRIINWPDGYSNNYALTILSSNSNIGIGTATPTKKLEVSGDIKTSGNFYIPSSFRIYNNESTPRAVFETAWNGTFGDFTAINSGYDWQETTEPFSVAAGRNGIFFTYGNTGSQYSNIIAKMTPNGLSIGTTYLPSGYNLSVNGKIICTEVTVQLNSSWPDYVFADDYKMPSLLDLDKQIKEKKHLPGIPTAKDVKDNGIQMGDMQKMMMQKIEELTLYVIELKKENNSLLDRVNKLEKGK